MDSEFKKLLNGGKWAANGDRADPGSSNISPQLVRATGWPVSYSQADGNTPDRRRMNQQFRELTGGAFEVRMGISPYDAEVDYPIDAITQVQGRLYRAKIANGPTTTNAISPTADTNETTWERVSGSVTLPDPPRDLVFDNSVTNALSMKWKNGRDGGDRIETYDFQHRVLGNDTWIPTNPTSLEFAQHRLTGLKSGQVVIARIRSVTDEGESDWYITAENAPNNRVVGNVPSGGNALGLYGEAGDARARMNWSLPTFDGGFPILRYRLQWRTAAESFSSSNESVVGAPLRTSTITGLVNDTLYYFRVRAENQEGAGDWSNIANVTPRAEVQLAVQPTLRTPRVSREGSTITANARWTNSATAPTATPTAASWQSRRGTSGSWSNSAYTQLNGFTITSASVSQVYQIRNRLTTSLGQTGWSDPATVAAEPSKSRAPGAPSVSISLSQTGRAGEYAIFVNWSAPNNGGFPIDAYYVRLTWNFGVTRSASASTSRNSRSYSFRLSNVPSNGSFTAYVAASNGTQGPWGSASRSV